MKIKIPATIRALWIRGFTLAEVLIAFAIAGIGVSGMIVGYTLAARRTEWSACSLAASGAAMQTMEQTVASRWVPQYGIDQLISSNFPPQVGNLCLPTSHTNTVPYTNYTSIRLVSSAPFLKMIRVDCVWTVAGTSITYTNTVATMRSPNL